MTTPQQPNSSNDNINVVSDDDAIAVSNPLIADDYAALDESFVSVDEAPITDESTDAAQQLAELQQQLQAATAKAEENWNLFLAARAEADNIQKRAERDVSKAHKYALEKFIPELLTVKDSIELGTKAAKESPDANTEQLGKFIEGSEMAITMFADVLAKAGVTMIDPQGEIFNPELHQAMTMIPNPALPANTIMEVVQKGYTLNERLLRPAMVIVSKAD
ncbi:MAG: nucleotide exchange factor GrpE [Gammaproteobacteria bacterium]|nr:MAG: nucleotide exchange factor GrpE [Gammaproteobacteria bacterium]